MKNIIRDDVRLKDDAGRGYRIGDLFVDDRIEPEIQPEAAIFGRDGGTEQARFPTRAPEIPIDDPLFLPARQVRNPGAFYDLSNIIEEQPLLLFIAGPRL